MAEIAIVGTREPEQWQHNLACYLSEKLSRKGHTIRTGGAHGIDHAAMIYAQSGRLKVYLPWMSYNREFIPSHAETILYSPSIDKEWRESVWKYHPRAAHLSRGAFSLHARNYGILKGADYVVALPAPGRSGGTGQAIRIAEDLKIPMLIGSKDELVTDYYVALSGILGVLTIKETT